MTQEDKQLLLKDLCARLPYGVILNTPKGNGHLCEINLTIFATKLGINIDALKRDKFDVDECKPYLRPMSSMTEEEHTYWDYVSSDSGWGITEGLISECVDWLNKNHFDYRGLIPKDLALEAPKGMYKEGE